MSAPPGYVELLQRNVPFRRLWLGVVASFFGDWFTTIALYAIVQDLSDSALAVAGVLVAKTFPIFAMTPLAGWIVDRFDRRTVLVVTDVLRAVLTLGLVGAYLARSLPAVFAVEVVRVCVAGVFIPGRSAAIPQVVDRSELAPAMALSGGTWSVMLALGAAAGGVVTELVGVVGALLVDSVTFLVSAAFLWGLPALPPRRAGEVAQAVRVTDALRYLQGRGKLAGLLLLKAGLSMASGAIVALPLYGNGLFAATASAGFVGLLYTGRGVGALIGSLGLRRLLGDATADMERWIPLFYLMIGCFYALLSWAPDVFTATGVYLLAAIGTSGVWVFSSVIGQRAVPRALRGRLFALEFGLMTLMSSTTSLLAGHLVDSWGWTARDVVLASGVVLVVPALAWAVLRWWEPEPLATVDA